MTFFDIQEKVSRSIADSLKLKLSPEENLKIADHKIHDKEVYDYYLRANEQIMQLTEDSINKGLKYLEVALEITGDNALLYSGIAWAYFQLVNIGLKQEDYIAKAEEYAKKALSVDAESSMARSILGIINWLQGRISESHSLFKSALSINPNDTLALMGILCDYYIAGRISEAGSFYETLIKIDPLGGPTNWCRAAHYYYDGRFGDALNMCRKSSEIYPDNTYCQFMYSLILVYNDKIDEAIPIIDQNVRLNPDTVFAKLSLILKYSLQGDKEGVIGEMTQDFIKTVQRDWSYAHHLAGFLSLANLKNEALDWLENSTKMGMINYPLLNNLDPFLENIRGEERFKKLMERVKYEWENFDV